MINLRSLFLGCCLLCLGLTPVKAQVADTSQLYKTLFSMDSLVFTYAFNDCDLYALPDLISDDFEFYHDKGGITDGKAAFIKTAENNICNNPERPLRKLVEGTMEVFPLRSNGKLYGVVQNGVHQFFIRPTGDAVIPTVKARFMHLWILEEDKWRLRRVISYDHVPWRKE